MKKLSRYLRKAFIMKKLYQFNNYDPDNAEQEDLYWDQNLSEEHATHNAKRTHRKESKSHTKRRKARKPIRKIHGDDYIED